MSNPFFNNKGPFNISVLLKLLNSKTKIDKDQEIIDIKDLISAENNSIIGHNSIIEKNVQIGNNCKVGSNVIVRNSIIKDNVTILDNCVIGKKGFGFFPKSNQNLRYPHIGLSLIHI